MKTLVIVALLVAITIPPSTSLDLKIPIYSLWRCPRMVRQVSDLEKMPECCLHPSIYNVLAGAANHCCFRYNLCTGAAQARPPSTTAASTTTATTTTTTTTTTRSAPLEGLDEPFLLWPQSSETFPIMKEGSDELTSVKSTEVSDVDTFLDKATFFFRAGLCGKSSTVSIESELYPGKFWRHQNSIMKLHSKDETNLFKEDSCFKISQGDCNNGSFTLESVNYPGYFIQNCDSQMKIRTEAENCGDVNNKCWVNPVSQQASLAYCSTIVTDVLDVPLHPECCHHDATLEEFGGCCLEIMNDNNDGCYETPAFSASAPVSYPYRPYNFWHCPKRIRKWQDIAAFPECCIFPPSRMVTGVTQECCKRHGLCLKKRKKRSIQGCPSNCRAINYCVRKMKITTNWYEPYPECCCHPFRKNVMMKRRHLHPKLYNEECKALGHPDVSG